MATSLPPREEEDQERFLDEALNMVKQQAFFMKQAIDKDDLDETLKCASNMLRELRTGLLTPKNYYELWMAVFNEMRHLQVFFQDTNKRGTPMVTLYQRVQYAGNVLPRLYLLMTVGAVYIESGEAPAKDILKDLVEMAKGVQFPTRGLFVRNYLSQISKDKLPDTNSEYEGTGGNVDDAIEFILQNFGEMNRLWVRMQHMKTVRNRKKREKERQQLKILVGTNLVRLSQLEGVDVDKYRADVLPKVLEQVTSCKDPIAQEYLMECIIQVFPDEFHLVTLKEYLNACIELDPKVDIKTVLVTFMDRIASYVEEAGVGAIPEDVKAFKVVNEYVAKVIASKTTMDVTDILCLQVACLNFANKCYPGNLKYIDHTLGFCVEVLDKISNEDGNGGDKVDAASAKYVEQLLSLPLQIHGLKTLALDSYPRLMSFLSWGPRKDVAATLLQSVLDSKPSLGSPEIVEQLLHFISPLVKDDEDTPGEDEENGEEFAEHQNYVARLVTLMQHDDTDALFKVLGTARKHFGKGGVRRIRHTLVPLCYAYLNLAQRVSARVASGEEPAVGTRKVFRFIHEIATALGAVDKFQGTALRLFLNAATAADAIADEATAYEFMCQAFTLYEETADSKAQLRVIALMIGTLQRMTVFSKDNFETLITKTALYAARLLKKPDQCRMVYTCAHLFWSDEPQRTLREDEEAPAPGQDEKSALKCLQRALKIADSCSTSAANVCLFVEILDRYLYFFERGMAKVTPQNISALVGLINDHIAQIDSPEIAEPVKKHFKSTIRRIKAKQKSDEPGRYADVSF